MRENKRRVIENFIASLDMDECAHVTRGNVERDIKSYSFADDEANEFRRLVNTAILIGKARAIRDLQEVEITL